LSRRWFWSWRMVKPGSEVASQCDARRQVLQAALR
jgi:hypothetical protein